MNNTSITTIEPDKQRDVQKAALYLLIALLVIFINAMNILSYFLRKKRKRSIPDVFILNLSVSAIMTMIFIIFILAYLRATGNEYLINGKFNDGLMGPCYVQMYFGTQLRLNDVSITTAITIDRFLALYKPLLYRVKVKLRHGKIACVVIWLISSVVAVLPLAGFGSITQSMESFCTADWTSEISYVVLSFAYLQFCVVLICYIGIFRTISGLVNRQKQMSRSQTLSYSTVKDPHKKLQRMNAIGCDDKYVGDDVEDMSYTNPNFIQDNLTKRVQELSQQNLKSLETVQEGEEYEIKTKVRIKSIGRRKVSSFSDQYYSTSSETNLDMSVTVNHSSELPHNHTYENGDPNGDFVFKQLHQGFKNGLVRSQSCLNAPSETKDRFEKAYSETSDCGNIPLGRIGRWKSISIIVKDKFKESIRRKNTPTASMKSFWAESQKFAKVMGVVVFLFYVSWLPLAISINIELVRVTDEKNNKNYYNYLWLSYNLSLISSVAVPVAYAVMCKPYREPYKRLWHGIGRVISCY